MSKIKEYRKIIKAAEERECEEGERWCPIENKCVPDSPDDPKGKGRRLGKGKGEGPLKGSKDLIKSAKKIGAGKADLQEIADIVEKEGLGKAVFEYLQPREIEDKKLAGLWKRAKNDLAAISLYVRHNKNK